MVNGAMMNLPDLPIPEQQKFTEAKLPALLMALAENPVLVRACKKAGIHPMSLEIAKQSDTRINELIEWAMRVGFAVVEDRIFVRAMGENRVPKLFEGKPVTYIDLETGETKIVYEEFQSDPLLKKMAERLRPDLYGDNVNVKVDQKTTVYLPQTLMLDKFEEMLAMQASKNADLLAEGPEKLLARLERPIEAEFSVVPEDDIAGLT